MRWLKRTQTDSLATAQRHAKIILQESERLMSILNQVLDYAKIEVGQMDIEYRPIDLARLIQDIGGSARTLAQEKGLRFQRRVEDDVPPYIKGDTLRLHQVLMNLISNALTFWFTVPFNAQNVPSEAEALSLMTENYDYEPDQAGPARILVVEDYAPNQDVVRMHLTTAGWTHSGYR